MPNVVLDASTIVSGILKPASVPEDAILRALQHDTVWMSRLVFTEVLSVLHRSKFRDIIPPLRRDEFLTRLLLISRFIEPVEQVGDCRDPKDNKYLELAVAASADLIVSGDRDLLDLDPWRGISILTPRAYVDRTISEQ